MNKNLEVIENNWMSTNVRNGRFYLELPHGSGIDCKWNVWQEGDLIKCRNEWHAMDNNGMYCGYVPFVVTLNPELIVIDIWLDEEAIQAIVDDYEVEEDEDGDIESNAPYLDDLDDYLYQVFDGCKYLTNYEEEKEGVM